MLSKNKIKFINTLKKKKARKDNEAFISEGAKIVTELIHSSLDIEILCGTENFLNKIPPPLKEKIKELIVVNESELKKISSLTTPNEALAVVKQPRYKIDIETLKRSLTLGLDAINDPGNLGTIIRIADWFGIKDIICSKDTVDVYNPKTVQATMGAISRVRVHYVDFPIFLEKLKNIEDYPIYGCLLEGNDLYKTDLNPQGLIIMGSESHGISTEIESKIEKKLFIPTFSESDKGTSESLNVSIATGIVCSEFRRRENYSK